MEEAAILIVVLVAIVAGAYTLTDTWNRSIHLDNNDKNDLD